MGVPPPPSSWHPAWEEVGIVVLGATVYALALRQHPASRARVAAFGAGLMLVLAVFVTPVGTLALNYLLSAHLFQNVALAEWAPALIVLGLSSGMACALARFRLVHELTRPLVALPLWLAAYGAWHFPAVYDAALRNNLLLHLEHATYFLTGVLLWWPVFHGEISAGAKSAYLFAAFVFASPIGLMLALLPNPIYDFYVDAPRVWGLDALTDQQIAGVIMAGTEAVVFFGAFAYFFTRFMTEEEAGYSPGDA
jgi:cytochrome c oxidase assembly factor CtaG